MPSLDLKKAEPHKNTPETNAARVRTQATQVLRLCLADGYGLLVGGDQVIDPLIDALFRLRHLQPGEIKAAIWCHRVLVEQTKRDVEFIGYPAEAAEVLQSVFNFLDTSGQVYDDGRWLAREEYFAKREATA